MIEVLWAKDFLAVIEFKCKYFIFHASLHHNANRVEKSIPILILWKWKICRLLWVAAKNRKCRISKPNSTKNTSTIGVTDWLWKNFVTFYMYSQITRCIPFASAGNLIIISRKLHFNANILLIRLNYCHLSARYVENDFQVKRNPNKFPANGCLCCVFVL